MLSSSASREFFASHRYIVGINNNYFPSAVIEMAGYLLAT